METGTEYLALAMSVVAYLISSYSARYWIRLPWLQGVPFACAMCMESVLAVAKGQNWRWEYAIFMGTLLYGLSWINYRRLRKAEEERSADLRRDVSQPNQSVRSEPTAPAEYRAAVPATSSYAEKAGIVVIYLLNFVLAFGASIMAVGGDGSAKGIYFVGGAFAAVNLCSIYLCIEQISVGNVARAIKVAALTTPAAFVVTLLLGLVIGTIRAAT